MKNDRKDAENKRLFLFGFLLKNQAKTGVQCLKKSEKFGILV